MAPREHERLNSAMSSGSGNMRSLSRPRRQSSARSSRSVTLSNNGEGYPHTKRKRSRSISSIKSEHKRLKDRELMVSNVKQLKRLQNAKASFDVTKWD